MTTSQQTLENMSQAVWYNKWLLNKMASYLGEKILEVGCGIGNFTKELTDFGQVWAIDVNKEYLKKTKKSVQNGKFVGFGDIEKGKYFFDGQKFNSVVCLNVLEHIADDQKALVNIDKLLKVGGYLILLLPAHNFLYNKIDRSIGHFRRYEKKTIVKNLEQIKYQIVKVELVNLIGGIGWWIGGSVLQNSKVENNKIRTFNLLAPILLPLESFLKIPFGISILVIAQKQ